MQLKTTGIVLLAMTECLAEDQRFCHKQNFKNSLKSQKSCWGSQGLMRKEPWENVNVCVYVCVRTCLWMWVWCVKHDILPSLLPLDHLMVLIMVRHQTEKSGKRQWNILQSMWIETQKLEFESMKAAKRFGSKNPGRREVWRYWKSQMVQSVFFFFFSYAT